MAKIVEVVEEEEEQVNGQTNGQNGQNGQEKGQPKWQPKEKSINDSVAPELKEYMVRVKDHFMDETLREQLRVKVENMGIFIYEKTDDKASARRLKGNEFFTLEKYAEAASQYTEAIIRAPFPKKEDEAESKTTSKELCLCFANRSAALFHLQKYEECIRDIDFALKFGYPEKQRIKLINRRKDCLKQLEGLPKPVVPKPCYEPVSDAIGVFSPGRGKPRRGCFAKRKITRGVVILVEEPFVASLKNVYLYCYHCFVKLPERPFPCRGCTLAKFCSETCGTLSWEMGHKFDCRYIDIWNRLTKEQVRIPPQLAVQLFTKEGVVKSLALARKTPSSIEGYAGALSLKECIESRDEPEESPEENGQEEDKPKKKVPQDMALTAAFMETFLNDYAKLPPRHKEHDMAYDFELFGGLLLKHLKQVELNAVPIYSRELKNVNNVGEFNYLENNVLGHGIYLKLNLMNHSCDPNARIYLFEGNRVVVRALRDIEEGEEIFTSFGPTFRDYTLIDRKGYLKAKYGFDCNCTACEDKRESRSQAMLCPMCSGAVMIDLPYTCMDCKADYAVDAKQRQEYEMYLRVSKMGTLRLVSKDVDIRKAEHPLLDAHRHLTEFMYPTHRDLGGIKEKLAYCYKIMRKFKLCVRYTRQYLTCLREDSDEEQLSFFNGLLKVIDRQRDFVDYCIKFEKREEKEYKEDFDQVLADYKVNVDLLLSLIERQTLPNSAQFEYYSEKLNQLKANITHCLDITSRLEDPLKPV